MALIDRGAGTVDGLPSLTSEQAASQILRPGLLWSTNGSVTTVTYAFRATPAGFPIGGWADEFVRADAGHINPTEQAFGVWNELANLHFERVGTGLTGEAAYSDNAVILIQSYTTSVGTGQSSAAYPGSRDPGDYDGDIQLAPSYNSFIYDHALHEIGHALGLAHPSESYQFNASGVYSGAYAEDSTRYSIMSYVYPSGTDGFYRAPNSTPMVDDIRAVQRAYGANMTTRAGNTVYGFGSNAGTIYSNADYRSFAIWDAGGNDTIDLSGYTRNQQIDLREGAISYTGGGQYEQQRQEISIAYGAVIENATGGAGADLITGNDGSNRLEGRAGADTLLGGSGADILIGGIGHDLLQGGADDDLYVVDDNDDVLIEVTGGGNDTVEVTAAAGSFQLAGGVSVETLRASAGAAPINIAGNWFSQVIDGNDGNNILSTGGGLADTMNGGLGDDIYRVFSTGDVINDVGGFDTVYASGTSYFLYSTAAVEYLSASEQAGTENFYIVGNGASQLIVGNYGDNTLNGRGGDGVALPDTLVGLYGNDTYAVFSQGDVVRESIGQGNDIVYINADYQLRDGVEVETLSAVDHSASDPGSSFTLRGNEFSQTVVGNNANNVLDGRGGNDTLIGLGGADTFAFTTSLNGATNVDKVVGLVSGTDRIGLASDMFSGVSSGGIDATEFIVGTSARDADDRLIYDQSTGNLFYDADGNGDGVAIQFAQLSPMTPLAASDFVELAPTVNLIAA
jgi:serralysin